MIEDYYARKQRKTDESFALFLRWVVIASVIAFWVGVGFVVASFVR